MAIFILENNSAARRPEDKITVVDIILISDCNCSGAAIMPDGCSMASVPSETDLSREWEGVDSWYKIKGLGTQ